MIVMKGKKMKNLYTLTGKSILSGTIKVKPHHESFASVEEVFKVKECNKRIMTSFSIKCTHWHMDKTNCKRNEEDKDDFLGQVQWKFELDTCLFLSIVQSWENLSQGGDYWYLTQIICFLFL